jgi:hypothetical protein
MSLLNRRHFLRNATTATSALGAASALGEAWLGAGAGFSGAGFYGAGTATAYGQEQGSDKSPAWVVELPRLRVPLSFIIDDSTCLVNMGRYCMPQFKSAWPDRAEYDQPWREWPHEIPDDFVRRFGTWCAEQGVRGKYSIVPYPACVGWLDRELPGWSRAELQASLKLVRELLVPNWDIHPEMITHTRVIDLKTGRPLPEINSATMENSYPQGDKSVDELAAYLAYALRILKNCDLPCEGITTPGGFGNRVKDKLPLAVFEAVRDVYGAELPHYFKYIVEPRESPAPRLEGLREPESAAPRVTVNVPAGTGDWFGGWDGSRTPEGDRYCEADAGAGRMVEWIERREPAIMFAHWAGLYGNGSEAGYRQFQRIILALSSRFAERTQWMKVSQIARYWAAKELTRIQQLEQQFMLTAPYACPDFTLRLPRPEAFRGVRVRHDAAVDVLEEVRSAPRLAAGCWLADGDSVVVCLDLQQGASVLELVQPGA